MKKSLMAAALMAALSGGAFAQGYAGVDVGSTKINEVGSATGFGLYGGYAFSKTMAVELGYRKLGTWDFVEPGLGTAELDGSSIQLSGLFGAEISEGYVAFVRLGVNQLKAKATARVGNASATASDSESKFLWGLGLDAKFTDSVSGRVEYQKPASDTGTISLGVKFGF